MSDTSLTDDDVVTVSATYMSAYIDRQDQWRKKDKKFAYIRCLFFFYIVFVILYFLIVKHST